VPPFSQAAVSDYESPLISVIIPTKDRRLLLGETLESLSKQTFPSWEAVIVDDGSTDGTQEFVASLSANDPRFRYMAGAGNNRGASACRNLGVSKARGHYVIFLDSDDLLSSDCLRKRLETIQQGEWDYVVFQTGVFRSQPGDDGRLWNVFREEDDLDRFLSMDMPWHTSGPIWKKSSLEKIGPWDESCVSGQDWEFHVRALTSGLHYTKVPVVDSFWRESRPGTISQEWGTSPRLLNRSELMIRMSGHLSKKGALTPERRRRIAAACHRNAFELSSDNRLALAIWTSAWRDGVLTTIEYAAVLVTEVLFRSARKLRWATLWLLLPESKVRSTHLGSDD
jgi:glycosyltransferase involved in cell wall biosynthesis